MALIKCQECGNEVSNQARVCPTCGAKVKKPTSLIVKILVGVVGVGILASLLSSPGTSKPSDPAATQIADRPNLPWDYATAKDDMSGKDISYAKANSLNKENLHWPYGPGIGATLTLRKHPRNGKDVYLSLDKGQILCRSYETCTIMIRFDDRPAINYSAIGPSDGSTDMVFIQNYSKFFAELKRSNNIIVELPLYQDGNRSWQFNVNGLTWQ